MEHEIFSENFDILHASLMMKWEPFEIFFKINNSNKAQFWTINLLTSLDMGTAVVVSVVLHNAVSYKVFWNKYFSAFPLGIVLLHTNI